MRSRYPVKKPHTVPERKMKEKRYTPPPAKASTPGIEPTILYSQEVQATF